MESSYVKHLQNSRLGIAKQQVGPCVIILMEVEPPPEKWSDKGVWFPHYNNNPFILISTWLSSCSMER